jgi:hypothetical protein
MGWPGACGGGMPGWRSGGVPGNGSGGTLVGGLGVFSGRGGVGRRGIVTFV